MAIERECNESKSNVKPGTVASWENDVVWWEQKIIKESSFPGKQNQ